MHEKTLRLSADLESGVYTSLDCGEYILLECGEKADLDCGESLVLEPGENAVLERGDNAVLERGENAEEPLKAEPGRGEQAVRSMDPEEPSNMSNIVAPEFVQAAPQSF